MARTPRAARWQRVPSLPNPNPYPTVRPSRPRSGSGTDDESPIYDRLAREWSTAGRTLPGSPDGEWALLTRFPPPPALPSEYSEYSDYSGYTAGPPAPQRGWFGN